MFKTKQVSNLDELMKEAVNYSTENDIDKIVIFSKNGESGLQLKNIVNHLGAKLDVHVIMFPANEPMFVENEDSGEIEEIILNNTKSSIYQSLEEKNINVIYGTLPLDNVVVPGATNDINLAIKNTLSMFTPGLQLAIQSIMIATDHGVLKFGEKVVSIVSDVAISATAANSRLLFHPEYGLKIGDIIAKKQ